MLEVDLGVYPSLAGGVEKVGYERKRVVVLLGDLVEGSEVHAKTE